ncbi:pyridoxal-phosphate dependent enzyme [bacterium]|nr:MAG: pyridoxal-phosphate dependent enzyme [bacterium]
MSSTLIAECLDCGFQAPYTPNAPACPNCGSEWREARYDYQHLGKTLLSELPSRPFNLWRYRELLPVNSPNPDISMGEGGTPMFRATNLGMMLGNPNIYIKDERQGPTHSFKDRQAAVSIAALKEAGINELVLASTGNVSIAYSAYAARAGMRLWVFLTSLVPAVKMRETALYGTQVVKVTGSYDQAKQTAAEFARQRGLYLDMGARSIPCIESMKTIAFETSEQLTTMLGAPPTGQSPWRAPDWYIQSISGGMGPLGVLKGYDELIKMGLIDHFPKFGLIQVEGCAPMVHAWKQEKDKAQAVAAPRTLIHTLATGDPGRTYTLLRKKILEKSSGFFEMVTDEEAYRTMHFLAKMEGLSVEPAAAVAVAGVVKMVRAGVIKPNETVMINCTGHTMPVERNILGEGWSKDLTQLVTSEMDEGKEEGLLAALSKVGIDRFPRIAIVDDNPDVRRLIRRILQSQGNYTLFEATNGREAVELAKKEHPNLMILDLMMPEMDGFAVMDALQADADTADIPVVVVTAKELTPAEKERLRGHIQSLMQKGDFLSDDLLDEVRALLG